ncbi:MAG TPA: methyltransferase domain-containing protein [Gaiellaceae bacterium]|nr:methyltransferase domain-containing protein [Gaiellaceae bacterium]
MTQQISFETYRGDAPENYERYFVPVIGGPLAADLVDLAALSPGEQVLDVACGTGAVARLAADRVSPAGTVVGVDVNPGMLAVARTIDPGATIEWHEATAETLPLADERFDVVLCQLGLQFMRDKQMALHEMWRVLVSGGRVLINVCGPTPPLFTVLEEALERHLGPEVAEFVRTVFSLDEADELCDLLSDVGFNTASASSAVKTLRLPPPREFLWQYVHSTPLAAAAARLDEPGRRRLERDVVAGWQPYVENGGLVLEVAITVATAQKRRS